MEENKFKIAKDYDAGFIAALMIEGFDGTQSDHWQAGYTAGYKMRKEKNKQLNLYLASIGVSQIHEIHTQGKQL